MSEYQPFRRARPVWSADDPRGLNRLLVWRAAIAPADRPAELVIAAATTWRLRVDGAIIAEGPARAAHGWAKVDRRRLPTGARVVSVEVCGYNANGYAHIDQQAFVQAEVVRDGEVIAATAAGGELLEPGERVRRVQRWSFMRPFADCWRLRPGFQAWAVDMAACPGARAAAEVAGPRLQPRDVPTPVAARVAALRIVGAGRIAQDATRPPWRDRCVVRVGPRWMGPPEHDVEVSAGFPPAEIEDDIAADLAATASTPDPDLDVGTAQDLAIPAEGYAIVDLGADRTGFVELEVEAAGDACLDIAVAEVLTAGDVVAPAKDQLGALRLRSAPGRWNFTSVEPYGLRYAKLIARGGALRVRGLRLRELAGPAEALAFACPDGELMEVLEAGRQTFRQNVVDLPMDCPTRERAPWLCDSFFTARVEPWLTGGSAVERAHLDAILKGGDRPKLPPGMFAMVYPGDHPGGRFIPNWALFLVLQLAEFAERGGDRALIDAFRPRVERLFAWFASQRGPGGLLERLPGWIFVEWSKANELVQDVNAPTNMVYAAALDAAARLWDLPAWRTQAAETRATLRAESFDGAYFRDRALRRDGRRVWTDERTEACQYYAFFTGVATPATHAALALRLADGFGPGRPNPDGVFPANAFIGFYLRLELLAALGRRRQLARELTGLFLPMARITGTLWENALPSASVNHGFASHVLHLAVRDLLGLRLDRAARTLRIETRDPPLDWCRARVPLEGGELTVAWRREGQGVRVEIAGLPAGWRVVDAP